MSIHTGANTITNDNISIQLHDREEFIEEFLRQKGYPNTSYISSPSPSIKYPRRQRWNYLHDFNKLYKSKLQEKREIQRQIEDEKEMKECTFEPKLNKSISFANPGNNNKSFNSLLNLNLIERQEAFLAKRKNDIKLKEKEKQNNQMQNCFFTPEINSEDALKKTKIKTKTINLLEDPESYSLYIKRLQKKREEVEKDKKREKERPGSGNIWERRLRNRRINSNSYDYTKHEYSRNLSRSKSGKKTPLNNSKFSPNNDNNKILKTEDSGRKITKKIKKGVDKNIIYEEIYKKNVYKMDDPYGSGMGIGDEKNKNENNVSNLTGFIEQDSIYNQPIEYGKAIDILHNALYSIDLEPEQGDNDYL